MAITANQQILTLDFWKYANQIKVGDYVFDKDGKPVKVKLVHTYFSNTCYRVTFDDHLTIDGDNHMAFALETPKYRNRLATYKGSHPFRRPLKRIATQQLLELDLRDRRGRKNFSVPTAKPLQLPTQPNLLLPPFLFGFWYLNHGVHNTMTTQRGYGDVILEKFKDYGYKTICVKKLINGEIKFKTEPVIDMKTPYIPTNYLMGSVEQRTELLSGLLHARSRQYDPKTDMFCIIVQDHRLFGQIRFLLESLAHRIRPTAHKGYEIYFKSRIPLIGNQVSPPVKIHHARRYIANVELIQPQMCVHIETEGPDNTILSGEGFISIC